MSFDCKSSLNTAGASWTANPDSRFPSGVPPPGVQVAFNPLLVGYPGYPHIEAAVNYGDPL